MSFVEIRDMFFNDLWGEVSSLSCPIFWNIGLICDYWDGGETNFFCFLKDVEVGEVIWI